MATPLLSYTELVVLRLIADGLSDGDIADALHRSVYTIRAHRDHLLCKTGCQNRVELTRWAIDRGHVKSDWEPPPWRNRASAG